MGVNQSKQDVYDEYLKMTDDELFSCIEIKPGLYNITCRLTKEIYINRVYYYKEKKVRMYRQLSRIMGDYIPSNAKETYMERIKNIALQKGWVIY